ncbi:hypothetical protein [Flavobacterium sp. XS2P14]|uniref:hypothetical protein n=1 Tax=Flavobacterium sp. XS2P14 TaxID=3401735 RepID=UPI003AAD1918
MKKITLILVFIGMVALQSCEVNEVNDTADNDTISEAFELRNVDFGYNLDEGYFISRNFNSTIGSNIYSSDVVLMYRLIGVTNSNAPIWQSIPRTIFNSRGELDYDFDFSKEDFFIRVDGNYNLELTPQYLDNQTFRIVIVPVNLINLIDKDNYEAVISALKISESQIQKFNF